MPEFLRKCSLNTLGNHDIGFFYKSHIALVTPTLTSMDYLLIYPCDRRSYVINEGIGQPRNSMRFIPLEEMKGGDKMNPRLGTIVANKDTIPWVASIHLIISLALLPLCFVSQDIKYHPRMAIENPDLPFSIEAFACVQGNKGKNRTICMTGRMALLAFASDTWAFVIFLKVM